MLKRSQKKVVSAKSPCVFFLPHLTISFNSSERGTSMFQLNQIFTGFVQFTSGKKGDGDLSGANNCNTGKLRTT